MPKVLYVGFGVLPYTSGGAIFYQDSLIEEINSRGWQTTCFFAAPRYSLGSKPHIKTWHRGKVKFIELRNPPYKLGCRNDPDQQCNFPPIEKLAREVLLKERPDIVHFQELQMHPASIMDIVAELGFPAVKTIHNYYDVCPQRDLMFKGKEICLDFDSGKRCVECLAILPANRVSLGEKITPTPVPRWIYKPIARLVKNILKNYQNRNAPQANLQTNPDEANQYLRRRQFFIDSLNRLDFVHCSSRRSADILIHYGLSKEKIKIIPNSTKSIEAVIPKPVRDDSYPVVFGYIGGSNIHKGYRVLIDAFSSLDQAKAKLIVRAVRPEDIPSGLNIEIARPWQFKETNRAFREIDVGVIPSIWEEVLGLVGIEWLAARIPVIGSNIGGIPEWLKDKENGFLVKPNDAAQLGRAMKLFVDNPGLIRQIQERMKPPVAFQEYIDQTISLYFNVINSHK
jgi:glycosyltransferase involved in cell wall biosynthesis